MLKRLNLSKYSKLLKILAIIPVLMGVLTLAEIAIPLKMISTKVVSKNETYRLKTDRTTYKIGFVDIDDQFTEEIYNALVEGNKVKVHATYFNEQIQKVERISDGKVFENDTGETYFVWGFGVAFLLAALSWFKSGMLTNPQSLTLAFITLFGVVNALRMFLA